MIEPVAYSETGRQHVIKFPAKPGPFSLDQINDADRAALREMAKNCRLVVEVGTFLGASAEALLEGMPSDGHLVTIDTFRGTPDSGIEKFAREYMVAYALQRLEPHADRLTVIVGDSLSCAKFFRWKSADLVFIDAAHDYENVKADIAAWLPIVKHDGLLAGHDFDKQSAEVLSIDDLRKRGHLDWDRESGVHCGVVLAVLEAFTNVMPVLDMKSSIWAAKPEWKKA